MIPLRMLGALAVALGLSAPLPAAQEETPQPGNFLAWIDCPGGKISFELVLTQGEDGWSASIFNGDEEIPIPEVTWRNKELLLSMPHYDSSLNLRVAGSPYQLTGKWEKITSKGRKVRMDARAWNPGHRDERPPEALPPLTDVFDGRWRVQFSKSDDPAVGIFSRPAVPAWGDHDRFRGTFLTTLGDYRYLAGRARGRRPPQGPPTGDFELSCFDGAHAFLFKGRLTPEGTIEGDFWSGDRWHETFVAERDEDFELPDAFELTTWSRDVELGSLSFPDLDGVERSLDDPAFAGRARIVQLFGTWCPNCHDEAPYLAELDHRYRERGLSIVGLAFEHTGELERDARQVQRYADRFGITYPILLAGTSAKKKASERFPLVDAVRAYPTTIFMDAEGEVRAIHTGFAGPATGAEHEKLRADFERLIEELLGEAR